MWLCPSYSLAGASLCLDMGYFLKVAPAPCSHCSGAAQLPLLTLDMGYLLLATRQLQHHTVTTWGSWRTQTEPCAPGPRRKEQWPHKRLNQTCPLVSRSLQWRHGLVMAYCRVGGTECSSTCIGCFEGGHHYLHYLHHSLAPHKQQGGNTAPPISRKLD